MSFVKAYLGTAVAFLAADALWLGYLSQGFYTSRLDPLLRESPDLVVAAVFYTLYAAGVVFFAVRPALASESLHVAIVHGALLGLLTYATYDLTNLATLKGWSVTVVVVDICWGTLVSAIAAAAGYGLARGVD